MGKGRKRSTEPGVLQGLDDLGNTSDEDCGGQSGGEDATERLAGSAPTRHQEDADWVECEIPVDPRDMQGMSKRRPFLRRRLDEGEEPILGIFLRFFPLQMYVNHLQEAAEKWRGGGGSKHGIPFDKGTFLRFLGVLLKMAMHPLPKYSYHWRWPSEFP